MLTDRSRIIKYQECPRKRYWANEFNGRGIVTAKNAIALSKGSAIHAGVQSLNQQYQVARQVGEENNGNIIPAIDVELAVKAALDLFAERSETEELALEEDNTDTVALYTLNEQKALIEFAVRGYALTRLPYYISTYRVVGVEQERVLELADNLTLMGRADSELQRLDTGGYYIQSLKTSFAWDDDLSQEAKIDIQGISELILFEALTGNRVDGIAMEIFVNGSRRKDKKDGIYKQDTFSIRPWVKRNVTGPDSYAWKYYYEDSFGANRSIGKSYQRVNIWEIMPIKEWVELLASGHIQPELGDPMQKLFVAPVPYYRQNDDINSWLVEVIAQELRIAEAMAEINNEQDSAEKQRLVDANFPRYRHACRNKYRKWCPYFSICWGSEGLAQDPLAGGLFKLREPHHELEVQAIED